MAIRLPPLKIDYLRTLTDDTGVFQHAKFCIPKRNEGYTTDDNARALIAVVKYLKLRNDKTVKSLANIYLALLNHMQKQDGIFHNYLCYERTFLDGNGSPDAAGRALWACGCVMNSNLPKDMQLVAKDIFDRGLPWVFKSTSLRFIAAALTGLYEYYQVNSEDNIKQNAEQLGDSLVQHFKDQTKDDWYWFEPHLTYDNARLPQALFLAYTMVKKLEFRLVAEKAMDFMINTQIIDKIFVPVGNDGWYKRGGNRPFYDQQPLEAAAMVDAAVDGYIATKNRKYMDIAKKAFDWFMGKNSCKTVMYDNKTGGCYDGLSENYVNRNQGAESAIYYLLARMKLEEKRQMLKYQKRNELEISPVYQRV